MEADGLDELVEVRRGEVADGLHGEAAVEGGLEGAHNNGGDGVFGLRGEHERDEGVEALDGGGDGDVVEALATHSVDGRGGFVAHLLHESVDALPVLGGSRDRGETGFEGGNVAEAGGGLAFGFDGW